MRRTSDRPSKKRKSSRDRLVFVIVLVLALVGLGVSIKLSDVHYETHTDPSYQSICAVNDAINCETVARSPYSVFLGAPVAAWGILGYILISLFAGSGLVSRRFHPSWPLGVIVLLITAAAAASSVLAFISFTLIDSLCLFCMTLYLINMALVAVMVVHAVKKHINPLLAIAADIRELFSKPFVLIALFITIGGATVALPLSITPYWHHPGWEELPKLLTGVDEHGHHWIGAKKPLVTIEEFSDYQCPHCRKAHKMTRIMAAKYPEEVRLVHRHLPLDQACNDDVKKPFHEYACTFSRAVVCAGQQDQFWAMNDAIFSAQEEMRAKNIKVESLAVELGLDRSRFKECMAEEKLPPEIVQDLESSHDLKIEGTPTFLVNGQPFEGAIPEEALYNRVKKARETR